MQLGQGERDPKDKTKDHVFDLDRYESGRAGFKEVQKKFLKLVRINCAGGNCAFLIDTFPLYCLCKKAA